MPFVILKKSIQDLIFFQVIQKNCTKENRENSDDQASEQGGQKYIEMTEALLFITAKYFLPI